MSKLPPGPWCEVSLDMYGPVPTGEYLLVIVDDYSRFPVVEIIHSTSARTLIPCIDKVFSMFGIPTTLKTDNGPPFNSTEFRDFANYLGFKHRKITPLWPQANGEAERFMKTITKAIHTARTENRSWKQELNKFLRNYRVTPHSTTKKSPSYIMFDRHVKTTLPEITVPTLDEKLRKVDEHNKSQMKRNSENRNTKESRIDIGDTVLVRQRKRNKFTTPYDPSPLVVIQRKGCMITAENASKRITRNVSFFKLIPLTTRLQDNLNPIQSPSLADLYDHVPIDQEDNPERPVRRNPQDNPERPVRRNPHRRRNRPRYLDEYQ